MARGEFDGFAGADQQHGRIRQSREGFLREPHGRRGDGHRVGADARVGARALGGGEGVLEQPVQVRAQRAGGARRRPGFLHLAEDLRFAEHQRVQPGRHAEQMANCVRVLVSVQIGVQVAGVGMGGEPVGQRVALVVGQRVQLGAVAGGEQRDFADRRHRAQLSERARHRIGAERNAFAQADRCGLVVDAENDEAHEVVRSRALSSRWPHILPGARPRDAPASGTRHAAIPHAVHPPAVVGRGAGRRMHRRGAARHAGGQGAAREGRAIRRSKGRWRANSPSRPGSSTRPRAGTSTRPGPPTTPAWPNAPPGSRCWPTTTSRRPKAWRSGSSARRARWRRMPRKPRSPCAATMRAWRKQELARAAHRQGRHRLAPRAGRARLGRQGSEARRQAARRIRRREDHPGQAAGVARLRRAGDAPGTAGARRTHHRPGGARSSRTSRASRCCAPASCAKRARRPKRARCSRASRNRLTPTKKCACPSLPNTTRWAIRCMPPACSRAGRRTIAPTACALRCSRAPTTTPRSASCTTS